MKFIPCLLSEDRRANHLDVCREMKDQLKYDPDFLSKIITGDESWCYGYDPETKQQSSQWKSASSPRPGGIHKQHTINPSTPLVSTLLLCQNLQLPPLMNTRMQRSLI